MPDQSESFQQWRTIQYIHPLDPPKDTVGLNVRPLFLMQIYEACTNIHLKGIGFVKRLYESGVIGLIGINLFIFIQKMTQTSSFVCLLVQTRLIVHYALALNVCTGFINLHKKQRPNIQPNCILWRI
jgi:hypothetical protein